MSSSLGTANPTQQKIGAGIANFGTDALKNLSDAQQSGQQLQQQMSVLPYSQQQIQQPGQNTVLQTVLAKLRQPQ